IHLSHSDFKFDRCNSIITNLCTSITFYVQPNHSKRKNFFLTGCSSVFVSEWAVSFDASETDAPSAKSTKHNGGNKTHHQFDPFPSPIVIKTASYSPAGYKYVSYIFVGNVTLSP